MQDKNFEVFSNKIRFMNFFIVFTMVIMHMSYWAGREDIGTEIMKYALGGGMSFFFFMSSFWFFSNFSLNKWKTKLIGRCYSLLLPYLAWNIIKIILKYGPEIIKNGNINNYWIDIIKSFLFVGLGDNVIFPANEPLWYVIRLMSYFIVAPLIWFTLKTQKLGAIVCLISFLVFRNGGYYSFEGWLPIVMLGAYIALNYRDKFIGIFSLSKVSIKKPQIGIAACITVHFLGCSIWALLLHDVGIHESLMRLIFLIFELLPLFIFNVGRIPLKCGAYSSILYFGHFVFGAIANKVFNKLTIIPSGTIHSLLLIITIMICSVALYEITKKYYPSLCKILTGGRGLD